MILDHGYHSYTVTLVLSIGVYDSACIDLCLLSCWNRTSSSGLDRFLASSLIGHLRLLLVQVRYVGGSNMTGWQLQLAASLAKKEGMAKYSVLQQQ